MVSGTHPSVRLVGRNVLRRDRTTSPRLKSVLLSESTNAEMKRCKKTSSVRTPDAQMLTSAALTCRHRPQVNALSHALTCIDSDINCIDLKWDLELASEHQLVNLMHRFGKLEWAGVDHEFRKKRFLNGVTKAAKRGSFKAFRWWMTVYLPDHFRDCGDSKVRYRRHLLHEPMT